MHIDPGPIQKSELFSSLSKTEIDFVVSKSSVLQLPRGASLFSIGQQAAHLYILTKGAVRIFSPRGEEGVDEMAHFAPGDCIGDFDFARGVEYDVYAEATEDSELIMFPGSGLRMDSFAPEELPTICRILLNSIIMLTGRIKSIRKLTLENLSWVHELHRRAYEDPGTGLWKQSFLNDEINRLLQEPSGLIMFKPDRFKILVDSRGHVIGDEAIIRISQVLRNIGHRVGDCWPMRFKSNEMGIFFNKQQPAQVEQIAHELAESIAALEPVPALGTFPAFEFTGTVCWAVWPDDDKVWGSLFKNTYDLLMESWHVGGNRVVHYQKDAEK